MNIYCHLRNPLKYSLYQYLFISCRLINVARTDQLLAIVLTESFHLRISECVDYEINQNYNTSTKYVDAGLAFASSKMHLKTKIHRLEMQYFPTFIDRYSLGSWTLAL